MSLYLYLSNIGKCLEVDLKSIPSLEALRTWIATNSGIPADRQILMTEKGKNVRQQHLISENGIFVYDKAYLAGKTDDNTLSPDDPELPDIQEFPSTLADENSLPAWQDLFMSRRAWAFQVTDMVKNGVDSIDETLVQAEVFQRCINVALDNLRNHFTSLQQSADKTLVWARELLAEHQDVLQEWKDSANTLSELPVREDITRLLKLNDSMGQDPSTSGTMLGILKHQSLEDAAQALDLGSKNFQNSLDQITTVIDKVTQETDKVMNLSQVEWPNITTDGLLPETEALAKQVNKDYQEVLQSNDDSRSISAISRRAIPHTERILPTLQDIGKEVHGMLGKALELRNELDARCKQTLKQISAIQSQFSGLHIQISNLKIEDGGQVGLEMLDKIFRLPIAYGSTLVEATRRSEWNDQMRVESESLRNDITQHKDAELRRRKKWAASLSGFLVDDSTASEALIDLTFSTPPNKWPYVSREEIFTYIEDLKALGINEAVEQVTQILKELESTVRIRRSKQNAFKNGSVHDLGQSMMRDGDQVRALQDDKVRLEEKLRSSDSRIRKLEDLLHRQSQLVRPTSGVFTPMSELERQHSFPGPSSSRTANPESRRSSLSLRRLSNQTLDEKSMVQRIVSLEAQITKLQDEAHAERRSSTESRDKMNEAESVKRDLMANFEAQKQEFDDERQLLEDESHKLKIRLDEVEDELDRVLGSRDHQKFTQDQVISNLRNELDKLRKSTDDELEQLRSLRDNAQRDVSSQRDRASVLERQLHHQKDERSQLQSHNLSLAAQLRTMEEQHQDFLASLQSAHANLSPSGSAPDDLKRLVGALEIVSEGAAIHTRGLDDALQLATAEKKSQQDKITTLEEQVSRLTGGLEDANKRKAVLQEDLNQKQNKIAAIRSELVNEQAELRKLRDKFAAGETGSDALKGRLADEEKRAVQLMEQNGENEARIQSLKAEIAVLRKKFEDHGDSQQALRRQFDARARKARDLSQKLFQQNDRMIRMLEAFGYFVIRQEDALLIQRASKVNASTTLSVDNGTPMKRTVSGSAPVSHYVDSADLEALYWIDDDDEKVEDEKYDTFIKAFSRLDLDSTIEIVTKRYKDVENLAKKYQKDSRGYRERSHRLQSEAHDKIAYRSFKDGDLALFLPTRDQATRPWAAFNVGAPHYFLREQDVHRLQSRDWLLARITRVEERIVDLSRSLTTNATRNTDGSDGGSVRSVDDENPFELSDGLKWYLIDAVEEKPGAPTTPGLGKSTVAASVVEVKGHMGRKSNTGKDTASVSGTSLNVAKTLHKSLDSRRSSETSRKSGAVAVLKPQGSGNSGIQAAAAAAVASAGPGGEGEIQTSNSKIGPGPSIRPSDEDARANSQGQAREDAKVFDVDDGDTASPASANPYKRMAPPPLTRPALTTRLSSYNADGSPLRRTHTQSPAQTPSSPANKGRPWDRLFSIEYNR